MHIFLDLDVALAEISEQNEGIFHVEHLLFKLLLLHNCLRLINELPLYDFFLVVVIIVGV